MPDGGVARAGDAADLAVAHALVNCVLRECGGWRIAACDGAERVEIPVPGMGGTVVVGLLHRSAAGHHRLALPARFAPDGAQETPLDVATLAVMLLRVAGDDPGRGPTAPAELMRRILDSRATIEEALDARAGDVERLWSAVPLTFAQTEQALLIGHPLHPTAKSRGEMGHADRLRYSPELRGRFRLAWLAVDPALVRHGSALPRTAPELAGEMLRHDLSGAPPPAALDGRVAVPAHPWELAHLRGDPRVAALLDAGRIVELGEMGEPYTPTTSVRTVHREDAEWQLKFSLHLSVTNSVRVTLPKELDRAVEAAMLAATPVGAAASRIAPDLVVLHDPAYLAVADGSGALIDGLSVLLRQNRWRAGTGAPGDVSAITVLCQPAPGGGPARAANLVTAIARRESRPAADVATEWFARYCEVTIVSLIRLYLDPGLCFEPHQQNTLLELEDGWPARCVVRDSQGYFHRELAHDDLAAVIPGLGEATESIFPEALADERLVYYPFVNNALGMVGALGASGVAREEDLLAHLRRVVERERSRGGRYPATLLDRVLDDARWPCKANLRTRLHGMDELVGDIATQSVYVTIPNPLAA